MCSNATVISRPRFRPFIARPGRSCLQTPAALQGEKEREACNKLSEQTRTVDTMCPQTSNSVFLTLRQRLLEGERVACGIVQLVGDSRIGVCQVNPRAR